MNSLLRYFIPLGVLATPSCFGLRPTPPPPALIGTWHIVAASVELPPSCRNTSKEFRVDGTVLIRSGEQVLTGTYTVAPAGQRFLLQQDNLHTNGEPNC